MRLRCVGTSLWHKGRAAAVLFALLTLAGTTRGAAQAATAPNDGLAPIPQFPLAASDLTIRQHVESGKPFTVAGQCGAFMGEQNGSFEAWIFPVKLLSHFVISAAVEGYPVPIDLNSDAAEIEVAPDHTTITYAHIAFTVREILFATRCDSAAEAGAGVIALFQIESSRPVTLTLSFTPEVRRMWPAPNYGPPSPEWVGNATNGYYLLHEDFPDLAGAIAMPGTHPGILAPYQEKPKVYPLQLILEFDPKRDSGKYFPLTMAVGTTPETATKAALEKKLAAMTTGAQQLYEKTADYYAHFFDDKLTVDSPDRKFDQALKWAEISIDQVQVRHGSEVGLVAGFYSSGDSARPGFGWYFGRDTLYTLFAVNSYGDFKLTREALDFLIKRQREDGKMPHEWSQTADLVDWKSFPYEYAAADGTPLFIMAMEDYVDASGDAEYLRKNWPAVEKAWEFERTHDTDGDGIYDNSQGTGWVESWPPGMPHQEIYLAALDQQASGAMGRLSAMLGDAAGAQAAEARATAVADKLEQEYAGSMYAFSYNGASGLDKTATIYPTVAWWDGHFSLKHPDAMFERWASHEFSTDWGLRDLGNLEALYDPISYHQGSVWPLFTGWTSVAEYRTGRPLSAYAHLMQNLNLTWQQDLGAVTELLSGDYFVPFGRSTTHQMWSSAMVITPAIRGLFGLSCDAEHKTIVVDPHLPATWQGATLHHVPVAGGTGDISFHRDGATLVVQLSGAPSGVGLRSKSAASQTAVAAELRLPLDAVEVGIPAELPLPGAATSQIKVLAERHAKGSLELDLEAQGGAVYELPVRLNGVAEKEISINGGELKQGVWAAIAPRTLQWWADGGSAVSVANTMKLLTVNFPAGSGYQRQTVRVKW
jgi:glycogen debranching enzyme